MSAQPGLSRRALLGLFRRPSEPVSPAAVSPPRAPETPPPAFSLEGFYAGRARSGEATVDGRIPVFSLREGLVVPQRGPAEDRAPEGGVPAAGAPLRENGPSQPPPRPDTADTSPRRAGTLEARPAPGTTVRVRTHLCLAWQGSFCTTCVERCPVEGAIVADAGRPRVVAEHCDGCGTCVRVCPAPINAFELRPAESPGASP